MLTYILFIIGFVILIKGANLLVDGAASIANKLKISSIVIGLTIVAFGTSAPEFIVNIFASVQGNTEIAIGNILGSNIANILLILGISAIIYPLATQKNTVWKEIPLSLLAAIILGVLANDTLIDGGIYSGLTRIDGIVLLSFFIIFLYYTFGIAKVSGENNDLEIKQLSNLKSTIYIIGGLLGLIIGGKWIVDGAIKIAELFNVSQSLIGLTVVAIGTSLPELATSAVAAYKRQTDIAIGNIVGSNIFNIFWILGASALIRPLPFSRNSDLDIIMTILASLILFIIMFVGKKHTIERWQGILMVLLYIGYVAFLISSK
ncbi:sodium:proton exchanger [Candidatus Falkowbacteria bacterium RIFOXYB2_FULL_34_18]|uniref:Sodium:proton exchanger n=1 Tax=Candidatus Falkowbacteria bacterium RIFOXYD2_FULL_34_120 TaxID=1798007 RepID=A0A1F5TQX3_9BACT|nr:MAG: sodium:proton exchanger [Candidatus Falkowbacteria bacterium RIFOXYB2_FULL_34_18]OGF29560.1 MAG: sodium:proton exchanger [Candidatus Falkowbacteria bacterium RIFOXYC12_FULL_34_55]OGF37637.1 MAG: sodium:proton exchanger [Candidatus Falkowbacteria bacterium RIFOXYC2_FULL_34_220]OGF39284.1 MAG: sodium:proton exchanger [Candidatus Falkowbacteria bacterium RIFOXYD12_FULL_34_57]OGF41422.1 MAG: sodium:proton exchanger [Candidatus Falkowbacteria bacterium RIFOXYD2_FULL_34_120]